MSNSGLLPAHLEMVRSILRGTLDVKQTQIFLFGSRITGNARPSSDIDILISGKEPIPLEKMSLLREKFENSNLPYKVDLIDSHRVNPDFMDLIKDSLRELRDLQ